MKNTGYARSKDDLVHLVSTLNSDYTACGDACDIEDLGGLLGWVHCDPQHITCSRCLSEIRSAARHLKAFPMDRASSPLPERLRH